MKYWKGKTHFAEKDLKTVNWDTIEAIMNTMTISQNIGPQSSSQGFAPQENE